MRVSAASRTIATIAALLAGAGPALAHGLLVFARIDGSDVVAEAKFSNGNPVRNGSFNVFDGNEKLILSVPVGEDGMARFPLEGAETGLRIEMDAGDGHYDYWILTPADIEAQRAPQG